MSAHTVLAQEPAGGDSAAKAGTFRGLDISTFPERTVGRMEMTTPQGDIGYFQVNDPTGNVLLLRPGNQENIVARFRSPHGNRYRFWIDDHPGLFPINLANEASFNTFVTHFTNTPGRHWCEIVDNPTWSPWEPVGSIPTGYGVHTYTERSVASTAGLADVPCPLSETVRTRTRTIDNGPGPGSPTGPILPSDPGPSSAGGGTTSGPTICIPSLSGPAPSTIPFGETRTYFNGCENVTVVGTNTTLGFDDACTPSLSGPDPSTIPLGQTRTYDNGCEDVTVEGTYVPPQVATVYRWRLMRNRQTSRWPGSAFEGGVCPGLGRTAPGSQPADRSGNYPLYECHPSD